MNFNFLSNSGQPNLPLRKPSSSAVGRESPPSSGQDLNGSPARPGSTINGQGGFLSPTRSTNSPANRSQITTSAHTSPVLSVNFCNFCGHQGYFRCKRCKKTRYCSVDCQTEDWMAHRHMCKPEESCASPVPGEKQGCQDNSDSTCIQRVVIKDLQTKVTTGTEMQAAIVEFQSPGRFFVISQSAEILEALHKITVELQKTYSLPTKSTYKPVVDEVCAVQYSCDMHWYRGLIQQLDADQAHVLYIDFGNEERVPFGRIRPLNAKLQQYSPCAIECCISGVSPAANVWSGKCCIAVRQLLEGKVVTVKVLGTLDNGCIHDVDIVLSNGNTLSSFLLEHEYAEEKMHNETPSEQDINTLMNVSMKNFKRHSLGKDDNSWAHVPEPLTQAIGDSFSVVVTHIQSPEKIVVQKVDNAGVIQDLQMKLREHCSQVTASRNFRPAPGTVCCALFSEDKHWYRAKVLVYSSEERVCVGYLDFGNSEEVDLNSLRPISQSLLVIPMQAMTCGLAGVQPMGEKWSDECLQALQQRISNRILRVKIQGAHKGSVLVALIDEASDPQANMAELLMFAGFAAPIVNENSDNQPTKMPLPASEASRKMSGSKSEPLVWSCAELSSEGQTVLKVCYVVNPGMFFCHIVNPTDNQRLLEMEEELKAHCEVETTFDPKLGEPCCAVVAETGGKCFRALIKQSWETEVLAALVDYGHSMRVKKVHLRPITSKFLELPFQALPCWLAGVVPEGSEWTAEALLCFQTLTEGETVLARVRSVTEDGYGVELQCKGQSVASSLVAEHLAKFHGEEYWQEQPQSPAQPERTQKDAAPSQVEVASFPVNWKTVVLPVNETFQPCVAATVNPSLFYLLGPRQVGEQQIQEMMLQLADYCSSQVSQLSENDSGKPTAGAACCARFTADNNWYRAVVLKVSEKEASVIYADYGNSEDVPLSSVLPIPERFLQLPFQITRCSVVCKELCPSEWPGEVLQMFLGTLQHGVSATVKSFDGFSNMLSLSLPTESGGVQVHTMILNALQALSASTTGPAHGQTQPGKTPANSVSDADAETSSKPGLPPEMSHRVEDGTNAEEASPTVASQTLKLASNTEASHDDPVQRIFKHMQPECTTDAKNQDALTSSCCCQNLKNKIDQLEQLMQVQLSLIRKLVAQTK